MRELSIATSAALRSSQSLKSAFELDTRAADRIRRVRLPRARSEAVSKSGADARARSPVSQAMATSMVTARWSGSSRSKSASPRSMRLGATENVIRVRRMTPSRPT